jgi:hypothetical protein
MVKNVSYCNLTYRKFEGKHVIRLGKPRLVRYGPSVRSPVRHLPMDIPKETKEWREKSNVLQGTLERLS